MVLFEKQRFYLIHEIASNFTRIADEAQGQGTAEIKTAVPLDAPSEAALVSRLEAMTGYKIEVKKEIDPTLIGGVVVKLKNKILDGSIRNQLSLLTKELLLTNV
jgi:F-type H+-transporting ATPase subunit delta